MKADLEKLIDNLEVFPLLEIRSDLHRDRDIIQFDSQQKEWWKEQTRRAIEQEDLEAAERKTKWTKQKVKKIRAILYNIQATERDKEMILDAMEGDILEAPEREEIT